MANDPYLFEPLRTEIVAGPNVRAVDATIAALRESERLQDVNAAEVMLARSTALLLDQCLSPAAAAASQRGAIARAHLMAVARLLDANPIPNGPDDLDDLLTAIRDSANA
jgi:hypothetical protein